ncbi:hypothetical protein AAIH09_33215, partial [Pseudomonas aeruginosa]
TKKPEYTTVLPPAAPAKDGHSSKALAASWVVPLEPLHQELTSAPTASWVIRPETLCQVLASAPPANWVLPLATVR